VVVAAADVEGPLEDVEEREVPAVAVRQQEAVPGAQAVRRDDPVRDGALERLERAAESAPELLGAALAEVQLGLLEQVQVDGREAQVAQAALDLVAQEGCVQDSARSSACAPRAPCRRR
jgi:hypothetical protein